MALNNLKAMQKEKIIDGDADNKKPALLKRKPMSMPAKKSGLAARLTGGK